MQIIKEIKGTTIGHKRILTFPAAEAKFITLTVNDQKAPTRISEMKIYSINERISRKIKKNVIFPSIFSNGSIV